jgi:CDP-diglyceride synthetase
VVITFFAWLVTAMIAIPLLVLTGVIELEEGEDPLAVLAIGSAILIVAVWLAVVAGSVTKSWLKRSPKEA